MTLLRRLALLLLVALAAYAVLIPAASRLPARTSATPTPPTASETPVTPSPSPTYPRRDPQTPTVQFPAAGTQFIGVFTEKGAWDLTQTAAFVAATGVKPSVHAFAMGWTGQPFRRDLFDALASRGMMPLMAWEPWDYEAPAPREEQARYRLSEISGGSFDSYILDWARGIKELDYPVAIRFAHEMNGVWYPWAEAANGNGSGEYVEAWRHVHDLFTRVGVSNVTWIWSPNVSYDGSTPMDGLYPGDDYVDWVGLVGYYGTQGTEEFVPFNDLFFDSVQTLRGITDKPIVVTETGATDAEGLQAAWIEDMFASLPTYRDIVGVVWFEATAGTMDFRLSERPAGAAAFSAAASKPSFRTEWTTNSKPAR